MRSENMFWKLIEFYYGDVWRGAVVPHRAVQCWGSAYFVHPTFWRRAAYVTWAPLGRIHSTDSFASSGLVGVTTNSNITRITNKYFFSTQKILIQKKFVWVRDKKRRVSLYYSLIFHALESFLKSEAVLRLKKRLK